ncbi:basic leucine zipper 43-like [Corylus avellana]|uniref:basic leucine zipper 43-like n=1 Tax=Corylus avellana TaxID=13451 RepID=UPI001E22D051|nr:basic leucine zipper 43-like [Corylus avellana]
MLSAYRVPLPVDTMFGNPFSAFDAGFTPWDCPQFLPTIQSPEPVISNCGSPTWEPDAFHSSKPVISSSGSDDPDPNQTPNHVNSNSNSGSGSDEPKPRRDVPPVDERKRRRMISNRESARRSRMRKQKHLENLRNQVNRFRIENRDLSNRLRFFLYHWHHVQTENNQLRSESHVLRHKLFEISRILAFRRLQQSTTAWPCNTATSEPIPPLIA